MSSSNDHGENMMIIEIAFGGGKSGEILVRYGDEPLKLAKRFARKHNLKRSSVELVHKHIENTIADFLKRDSNGSAGPSSPGSDDNTYNDEDVENAPSTAVNSNSNNNEESLVSSFTSGFSPDVAVKVSGLARAADAPPIDPQQFGLSPIRAEGISSETGVIALTESNVLLQGEEGEDVAELDMSYQQALVQQLSMEESSFVAQSEVDKHEEKQTLYDSEELHVDESGADNDDPRHSSELDSEEQKNYAAVTKSRRAAFRSDIIKEDCVRYKVIYEHGTFVRDRPSRNANNMSLLDLGDVVIVTGKTSTNPENGVKYLELAAGGWVPLKSQAGHVVMERDSSLFEKQYQLKLEESERKAQSIQKWQREAEEGVLVEESNQRQAVAEEEERRLAKEKRQEEHKKKLLERMQRAKEDDAAKSAALAEAARLKQVLVEQQLALQQAQFLAAEAEREKAEAITATAASKAIVQAEMEDATAAAARATALEEAKSAMIREIEVETEQQRVKEKLEHEQWLQEQRSVDVTHTRTEELYDRMRAATSAKKPTRATVVAHTATEMSSISIDNTVFDPSTLKVSSSFALTSKADLSMVSSASYAGSLAHDRLHQAASVRQKNRINMKDRLGDRDEQYMTHNRYTMNATSRNLTSNMKHTNLREGFEKEGEMKVSHTHDDKDLLHRLYEEGRRAQLKKKAVADTKEQAGLEPFKIEEWSCVRCGVFHTIDHNTLLQLQKDVQTSHRVHSTLASEAVTKKAALKANTDAIQAAVKYHSKMFRCPTCGFERPDAIAPHQPLNIALRTAEQNGTATQLLARRTQAIESSGGVVEYLRSNHQHVQGQLQRQRKEWDRKDQVLTFQPRINEVSRQLVDNKIALCKAINSMSFGDGCPDRLSTSDKRGSFFGMYNHNTDSNASELTTEGGGDPHLSNNVTYGNYLSSITTSGYKNRHGDRTPFPTTNQEVTPEEAARLATEKRLQADRATWLHAHTIHNKKTENSVNYAHDSKPTKVSDYFQHNVIDRLSANIKPHIVKQKHENKNKYKDQYSIDADHNIASSTEVPERKEDHDYTVGVKDMTDKQLIDAESDTRIDFVTRNKLWQRQNQAHTDKLRHKLQKYDHKTQQPLFTPKVEAPPNAFMTVTTNASDIVHRLSTKDAEAKKRRAALVQERLRESEREQQEKQVTALPQSKEILAKATERSIKEMFRLLLVSVGTTVIDGIMADNSTLSHLSSQIKLPGDEGIQMEMEQPLLLDLALAQPTVMVPEVTELLLDVLTEKEMLEMEQRSRYVDLTEMGEGKGAEEGTDSEDTPVNMMVTFPEFRELVLKCMDRRGKDPGSVAVGRSYVYAPRKKPEIASRMAQAEIAQETFVPTMPKGSTAILRTKGRKEMKSGTGGIEVKLLNQGQKDQRHKEVLRKQQEEKEKKNLTFRPHLFKPPKGLNPRYRGVSAPEPVVPVLVPVPAPASKQDVVATTEQSAPKLSGKTHAKTVAVKLATASRAPPLERLAATTTNLPLPSSYTDMYASGRSPKHVRLPVTPLDSSEVAASNNKLPPPPFPAEITSTSSLGDSLLDLVK